MVIGAAAADQPAQGGLFLGKLGQGRAGQVSENFGRMIEVLQP
jgi:hypothetical protein